MARRESFNSQEEYNEFMRVYMRERYGRFKKRAFEYLGKVCAKCGAHRDLQIDHKNPRTKTLSVARMACVSWSRAEKELKICQLLCGPCHVLKTILERGNKVAKGKHGTLSSYTYCHCVKCRQAKNAHHNAWCWRTGRRKKGKIGRPKKSR